MKLNARGGVSIAELVVYFPSLLFAFLVCRRHGFNRASGWVFTLILCLIRIIGSCCQLATYSNQSIGLLEATFILQFVGLSPLLYATLGLLSRCVDAVNRYSQNVKSYLVITRITQLVILLGLILSIVGGTSININATSPPSSYKPQTTSEAGVILYVVAFVILVLLALNTLIKLPHASDPGEKKLLLAFFLALPFILTRLAYSIITVFVHDQIFNLFDGNVVVYAVMSVLMEFIVVIIYLTVGWFTDALPMTQKGPTASRPWKGRLFPVTNGAGMTEDGKPGGGGGGGGGRGHRERGGLRGGPIHMAIAAAREHASQGQHAARGDGQV